MTHLTPPHIDYQGLAPLLAVTGGSIVVLMASLFRTRWVHRVLIPALTVIALGAAIGLSIWNWQPGDSKPIMEGALAVDTLSLGISMLCYIAGIGTVFLSLRSLALRQAGGGEYFTLMLGSIAGMNVLASAENLVTLFVGLELLSIPLYVLCATEIHKRVSLEAGLKYLVIGSVGSGTLLYGLAFVYGATGATDFSAIATAIGGKVSATDPMLLTGIALAATGLAFKASIAPFHTWTPDVYQGAPTPVTAFMAVATKAAAFAVFLRLFVEAFPDVQPTWSDALAALAMITIVVGNVGALPQRSLKRLLAWSGVGQAGYILTGVIVGTQLGLQAMAFYLAVYLVMNMAAFAVVIARERVSPAADDISSFEGLGRADPWLALPLTIAMLGLAGFPATAGFIGKFYLLRAAIDGGWDWLAVFIVIGSIISLGYYLKVVAVMWLGPVEVSVRPADGGPVRRLARVGGWSPEAEGRAQPEVLAVAVIMAAGVIFFGIVPSPLLNLAADVGTALQNIFS
ncbi:MAG TPA: NADH-quinone oxidoreductase subunit N [Thermoleophilaceae bacterium]|nr:NADH-quinone oxidoreductase subunit N [Thermoleophilaceae bacterium]